MLVRGYDKLIATPKGEITDLFNLADDPYELTNLVRDPAQKLKLASLKAQLLAQMQKLADGQSLPGSESGSLTLCALFLALSLSVYALSAPLRFEITLDQKVAPHGSSGRLLVFLADAAGPRRQEKPTGVPRSHAAPPLDRA